MTWSPPGAPGSVTCRSCGPTPVTPTARPTPGTAPPPSRASTGSSSTPLDQDWLNYQHEIGLRHTRAKKNLTDHADSLDHIPLRYLLAFTAVVIATSRDYLAAEGASPQQVDRMHAAFTKSVMLHVTAWTRPYVGAADW
jgi:hypothetical protein